MPQQEYYQPSNHFSKLFEKDAMRIKEADPSLNISLGALVLIAGFIRDSDFIAFANERFGKNEKLCVVNVGEALAVTLLMLASGLYRSMRACANICECLPLVSLLNLNPSIKSSDFNRDVMSRALAILSQDGERFFNDFATHVYIKFDLGDVIEIHVDSTSMYFYKLDSKTDELIELSSEELSELK